MKTFLSCAVPVVLMWGKPWYISLGAFGLIWFVEILADNLTKEIREMKEEIHAARLDKL